MLAPYPRRYQPLQYLAVEFLVWQFREQQLGFYQECQLLPVEQVFFA